ncbi:type IV inositol polyphosphate 5-phosphatase 3-like isoform X3 [Iris pallida]|uniref:Type IV inositol polyphosphate 5-phosphatase 3-like isoform X3 n=1 Tax=Iris pallida TaxID=29817 RepID=A0AAX6GY94_IRIPA|nr:type IV inositol polyphosphate 5-phosphatase 3-like isoform X3 [Iris pallida]KAJ6844555.1 type IV inositol polyphosphate 5-phosphatase 3-like isoform X3 [Iris pallida]
MICVGTWNVGGKLPPDDLNIEKWIDVEHPADIYVLGLQEIVPLNAGNIFGADDSRPVPRWECLIRETLSRVQPAKPNYKCYSDPSSPSRFKPPDDPSGAAEELLSDTDTDTGTDDDDDDDDEVLHVAESSFDYTCDVSDGAGIKKDLDPLKCLAMKRLQRYERFIPVDHEMLETEITGQKKLTKRLSGSARIGLAWPEQSLDLLAKCTVDNSSSLMRSSKSFRSCRSFKTGNGDFRDSVGIGYAVAYKRRRSGYVKIVSKQMVGIYLTIWVRRPLRKYVQNLKVSTVGVGIMGYIGNKGSVSVSMSIYQTLFCFICTHLSSGEKIGNELRRNIGVHEIHRRTRFSTSPSRGLLQTIHDHERIFWLGDLNYRINLPYERTHELISKKKWSELLERDQLKEELNKGHAFDGWSEGHIMFPPTYKFELNSDKYVGIDDKGGRRTPAWCDRILSFGTGMRLLDYRSSELRLSDHRPVTAKFMAEVEVFRHRKLQKALTLTDAEIEDGKVISRSPLLH